MCSRICKHNYRITIIVKIGYRDHSPAGLVVTGVTLARDDMHSPRATGRPLSIHPERDLDALMDWGSTWGMKFNAKKCNIMRVSRSRKPLQHFYSLGNEILQEVSDAKYLGIQIDNKLDWNKHISTVAARGQSKLAFLNRNLKGCPKKLRDTAYISLIIGLH